MKLTVLFTDSWGAWNEAQLGLPASNRIRRVTIELTNEQAEKLQKRKVGGNGKDIQYESIGSAFIEEEK